MDETTAPQVPKSDLPARFKTGVIAGSVTIAILLLAPNFVIALVALILAVIGIFEFDGMFGQKQIRLSMMALIGSAALIGLGALFGGAAGLSTGLLLAALGLFFHYLVFYPAESLSEFQPFGICLFGIIWIPWSFNHLTLVHDLPQGTALLFLLVLIVWTSDIAAYFGGRAFGKMPLAPKISPKKTVEGSICGAVGAAVLSIIFCHYFLEGFGWFAAAFIGISTAVVGQLGDLVESKIKRLCEVKDSGTIFPGHGGVLDRVDGFLTAAPFFFYIMYWIA